MIDDTAKIGENVQLGDYVVIEKNVVIGNDVEIGHHAVVKEGTVIGNNVLIKENTVLGQFPISNKSMSRQPDEKLNGLWIDDHVKIGSNSTLYRGSIILQGVLIGDLASIRENVTVEKDSIIGRNVIVENDTTIGKGVTVQTSSYITANMVVEDGVFIGPCFSSSNDKYMGEGNVELKGPVLKTGSKIGNNVSLLPGITIGEKAVVGAGAVVTKDVSAHQTVIGNPAKQLVDRWNKPIQ